MQGYFRFAPSHEAGYRRDERRGAAFVCVCFSFPCILRLGGGGGLGARASRAFRAPAVLSEPFVLFRFVSRAVEVPVLGIEIVITEPPGPEVPEELRGRAAAASSEGKRTPAEVKRETKAVMPEIVLIVVRVLARVPVKRTPRVFFGF